MSFSIETIKEYSGRGFKCALFDFDGTISLIREGWQKVMIPYFCEVIEALGTNENKDGICEEVTEFVDRLTGKQTIFQCIALNEAVVRRGGEHVDPGEYKKEYLRRLETRIADRKKWARKRLSLPRRSRGKRVCRVHKGTEESRNKMLPRERNGRRGCHI